LSNSGLKKIIEENFKMSQGIICAVAYGSSAIPQKNNPGKMLDLILVVNDNKAFHQENLVINNSHYSFLNRSLKWSSIGVINRTTPQIFFNNSISLSRTNTNEGKVLAKYGVIQLSDIEKQLNSMNNFFVLGRLHKPVITEYFDYNDTYSTHSINVMKKISEKNKNIAFSLACLLTIDIHNSESMLDSNSSANCLTDGIKYSLFYKELFYNLVSLSYTGDIRFSLKGEKKSKISDIVEGGYEYYLEYYADQMKSLNDVIKEIARTCYSKDQKKEILEQFLLEQAETIPQTLINKLNSNRKDILSIYTKDQLAKTSLFLRRELILPCLSQVNYKVSRSALFTSFLASRFLKGFYYIFLKYKKALNL